MHEHQGLVAYDSWGGNDFDWHPQGQIVVAFRGSQNWKNWIANIDYFKKRVKELKGSYPKLSLHSEALRIGRIGSLILTISKRGSKNSKGLIPNCRCIQRLSELEELDR